MILLLGADSYVGQGFAVAMQTRQRRFVPLTQSAFDYSRFELLFNYIRSLKPELIINAETCIELECEFASDQDRLRMLRTNTLLPQTIARVCGITKTPWAHVSSGGIYRGAKVFQHGELRVEADLSRPAMLQLFDAHPDTFLGFSEYDEPNSSFHSPASSFYSGTKALAEEMTREQDHHYTWRLRLPFSERDNHANFLLRLMKNETIRDGINSLSHVDDSVRACLELWDMRAPFGTYNVVNTGAIATREILGMIQRVLKPVGALQRFVYEETPRDADPSWQSGCLLDNSKLRQTGVKMRPVHTALFQAISGLQSERSKPMPVCV
jgi:dTDP-4-dehydrorhamnose reductase